MSDLISRQDAIDVTHKILEDYKSRGRYDKVGALTAVKANIKVIPSAEPEQQWIPCSERLPEKDGIYWITAEVDGIKTVVTCIFYDGKWGVTKTNVLAWQTFIEPEPWKGDENGQTN